MSNGDDRRLIEDYLPIEAISKEASREKSVRKGHISTLHLWWARRPLVACRAAVYGALVPASRFAPKNGPEEKRESLTRANAAKFVERLCKYPGDPHVIAEAQRHILEAHAERLTNETGKKVTVEDIQEGRAPRPKVLDMFAGGGAIPLEALRLGCEAYALDLNPVAHIIELCTLVYPQKYGKPETTARGMTGPKNEKDETTWGGLAEELRYWGNWVLKEVEVEIGDLYPLIPDPEFRGKRKEIQGTFLKEHDSGDLRSGYLVPVAYLWTRTVKCKNPHCGATVPLVRQTWLCKKDGRYVALKMIAPRGQKQVQFEVVEARSENGLGFDPGDFSKAGNAVCPFCGSVADSDYVKEAGALKGYGLEPMAVMAIRPGKHGKLYLAAKPALPQDGLIGARIDSLSRSAGIKPPNEPLEANPRSFDVQRYGFNNWRMAFTERQSLTHMCVAAKLREAFKAIEKALRDGERAKALYTCTALAFSRLVTQHNAFAFLHTTRETIEGPWGDGKFPMSWDFVEANLFSGSGASLASALDWTIAAQENLANCGVPANVSRGSALTLSHRDNTFDCVITDPPYYDSVSYSNLADAFYIWLKRSIGLVYPEHFATELTPKKSEAIMAAYRHHGDKEAASRSYESMMAESLKEARRVLKPSGLLTIVYAHKTTLGWSTLVNALRAAEFTIEEAWPLATEMKGGRKKVDKAMLASSIFLVARKREPAGSGDYEEQVEPELEQIVRERVETLWAMGISGADLVIACVGAGLRAFTRFARVEYGNGEEVPAERFLTEVETVVLETILARLSKEVGGNGGRYSLAGLDPATRFYVLWRYTYKAADLDAGEAIIFANGTHVELEGANGLSSGTRELLAKNKSKYSLLDYTERGDDAKLGLPSEDGQSAPLVDALHRLLWLMDRHPSGIPEFLREARPNTEQMRLVAQALAGPALKGGEIGEVATGSELAALTKLTANWRSVVEDAAGPAEGPLFRAANKRE
jgi:putative DNA methylase